MESLVEILNKETQVRKDIARIELSIRRSVSPETLTELHELLAAREKERQALCDDIRTWLEAYFT